MKKQILIVAALLASQFGFSQEITLENYREQVFNYNQEIKKSKEAVDAAVYSLKSIRTGFYPRLDFSGSYAYQIEDVEFMPGVNLKNDTWGAEVALVQNIYSGSAVRKQTRGAEVQQAIAELGHEYTIDNILYAADVNYWTVVANRDLYHISQRFLEITKELASVIELRFKEGSISKTDLLMIQTRVKEAELQLSKSYTNYTTAVQAFNVMRGAEVGVGVVLPDTSNYVTTQLLEVAVDSALQKRADYQITEKQIELAERQKQVVSSQFLPQVVVGLKERFGTTMINIDGDSRFTTTAFAQVNIPIFNWGERRKKVNMSRTQIETRELEKQKKYDDIRLELSKSWTQVEESEKSLEIVSSALDIAKNNLELNTFSYNEGRLPILDVLSAQVSWLQSYTNVVSVNYQYHIAQAAYIKAYGGYGVVE